MAASTRTILALFALFAIGQQLVLHIGASFSALNFFSYFTNLSNLFAACVLIGSAWGRAGPSFDRLRFVSTVNMVVVGLVFAILLRNVDLGALLPWVNIVLHYVMPVAVLLDWLLRPPTTRLASQCILLAMVLPILYLAYSLVRGGSIGWYPYPFLNPANVGGYAGVAMYAAGIAATFMLAASALLAIGNRHVAARLRSAPLAG